jgi:hypothetical protein
MSVRRMFASAINRINVVGLLSRGRVPFPVPRHGHRIDREDRSAAAAQGGDQQTARGLDRHRDLVFGSVAVLGEQIQQLSVARCVVCDPQSRDEQAFRVDQRDVVVVLGPIYPAIQSHRACPLESK